MGVAVELNQFLMMLYKDLLFRKRHYIVTCMEIIMPLIIASIVLILHSQTMHYNEPANHNYNRDSKNTTLYSPYSPFKSDVYYQSRHIIFTPETDASRSLVEEALKLWVNKSNIESKVFISSASTENELEDKASQILSNGNYVPVIGVVLYNFLGKDQLPESLKYAIRYGSLYSSGQFQTNAKYSFNAWSGPRRSNAYTDTYFLAFQAAIEQTFIKLHQNNSEKKDLEIDLLMQRFPYPRYTERNRSTSIVDMIHIFLIYGYFVLIIVMVKRVVEEKSNRSKELLKMMGMTDCVYWSSTFLNYFTLTFIINMVITFFYKAPLSNGGTSKVLKHTDFFLLFVLLLLFAGSTILFCLAVTTFFNRAVFAVIVVIMIWIITHSVLFAYFFVPDSRTDGFFPLSQGSKLAMCLLPTGSVQIVFKMLSVLENTDDGAQWNNIQQFVGMPDINLAMVMAMMLVSCVLYAVIIWYVDAVWPWQFGVPKPFYFPFTKSYWCGSDSSESPEEVIEADETNSEFFEEGPRGVTPGIVIDHLSKVFSSGYRSKAAVNDISMNIYSGQITALLGHNGAGKTTTISMLTGLFLPTCGTASINGWDIRTQTKLARRNMGICPQHNVLYDTLTVEEHLKLYAGLKGVQWNMLSEEASKMLKLLKLEDKRNTLSRELSGGMKRKLSLAIAVIGGSKVLFLDEPTSGMDPEARRSVWDALLDIRHDRTIILTTHFMEEADILGDRIAIMANGEIQCCGSAMFLKRKFGTGYHLHIVKDTECNVDSLTAFLQSFIPETGVESSIEREITYSLSAKASSNFGKMFQTLETQKSELGICSFGISVTTMEDVFLNVATITEMKLRKLSHVINDERKGSNAGTSEGHILIHHLKMDSGFSLWIHQVRGLFLKRLHYAKRHWSIVIAQIIIPFSMMCLFLGILENVAKSTYTVPLKLNLESVYGDTYGFYHSTNETVAQNLITEYHQTMSQNGVDDTESADPQSYILSIANNDLSKYLKKLIVGGTMEVLSNGILQLTAWYNGEPLHATPMSLNIMHTALLRYIMGSKSTIDVTNAPLPVASDFMRGGQYAFFSKTMACVFIPLTVAFLSASYVLVPIQENSSKAKLLQLMTGISAVTYWTTMFMWDIVMHVITCVVLLLPFAFFNSYVFFPHPEAIGSVILMFLLYGWCCIPFGYLISLILKKPATGFSLTIAFNIITGLVLALILSLIFTSMNHSEENVKLETALWFLRLLPSFAVTWGFSNLFKISFENTLCESIPEKVLNSTCITASSTSDILKCCKDICGSDCFVKKYPITWDHDGCGRDIFFLFLDGCLLFALLFFCESSIPKKIWKSIKPLLPKRNSAMCIQESTSRISELDSDVVQEAQRVEHLGPSVAANEALVVSELTKNYKNLCAVDHLTFGVHQEECFGLLGVNGAGKTTTFKMLTGDISPSKGNACIHDNTLQYNFKKYQSCIGYCPQFDALIDRLTGREMLLLFARLRGVPEENCPKSVNKMIKLVDLTQHADKQTQLYSGGNKRKLSLALALIGSPPLILLDEPSSGVDPASRRKIWNVLSQARNVTRAAIILTTHSMEECEALCSRLAIMVNGQFRCLGSIQHLKSKFGQGHTVVIKLKNEQREDHAAITVIKRQFEAIFPSATLKDDHQGMLQYHVADTSVAWSKLFTAMEDMKQNLQLEDYLISDTTLEQIFLAFARTQRVSDKEYT